MGVQEAAIEPIATLYSDMLEKDAELSKLKQLPGFQLILDQYVPRHVSQRGWRQHHAAASCNASLILLLNQQVPRKIDTCDQRVYRQGTGKE